MLIDMSSRTLATVVTGALLLLVGAGTLVYRWSWNNRFDHLEAGLNKLEVERRLGKPDGVSREPVGILLDCDAKSIEECWSYGSGPGEQHTVCFDQANRLVCTGSYFVWI